MVLAIMVILTGCSGAAGGKKPIKAVDGYAEGRLGDTFSTYFFEYSVDSAAYPESYEGYTATEGMQLIDVVISLKNTDSEAIPMFNNDFQVQWHDLGEGDEDYGSGVILENSTTSMPEEFTLERAATAQYHIIYEVPAAAKDFSVSYLELFDDNAEGSTFFTFFENKESAAS